MNQVSKMISQRLADSKTRANKKGIDHNIDHAFIKQLLMQSGNRCPITKQKFVFESKHPFNFSVDRIDSNKGYTRDNVWIVSTWANRAKSDLSFDDFVNACKMVVEEV